MNDRFLNWSFGKYSMIYFAKLPKNKVNVNIFQDQLIPFETILVHN